MFVWDKPLTKCFQKLMVVVENVYVAQMIVNGFLLIGLYRFTQTHDRDWHPCPKCQMFCICMKLYPNCQPWQILTGVHSNRHCCIEFLIVKIGTPNISRWKETLYQNLAIQIHLHFWAKSHNAHSLWCNPFFQSNHLNATAQAFRNTLTFDQYFFD